MKFTFPCLPGLIAIMISVTLSGCAAISSEQKVRVSLVDAGLSHRTAKCMASRMVDRLSVSQLRRLQSLASLKNADIGAMSVDRLLNKVRAIEDPEVFIVTSRAALACSF